MRTGLRPLKSLSQNFLKDETYARRLVESMAIQPGETVLEIGAGEGVLTRYIMQSPAARFIAVELDKRMQPWLQMRFGDDDRFHLIPEDFLKMNLDAVIASVLPDKIRVCGNLPYAITSPILFALLDHRYGVKDVTVTIQKEVAERFVSSPGCKAFGVPSVLFQLFGDLSILFEVPPVAFEPVPKVESAVMCCRFLDQPRYPVQNYKLFEKLVKTAFGQRRKMLRNTIKSMVGDRCKIPIDLTHRPEELSVETWAELANWIVAR